MPSGFVIIPSRQQGLIKHVSPKCISPRLLVIHLALTSLSDYSLCLSPSGNVHRGKKTSLWWGHRSGWQGVRGNSWGGERGRLGEWRAAWEPQAPVKRKDTMISGWQQRQRCLPGNLRRQPGWVVKPHFQEEWESQPHTSLCLLSLPLSPREADCLFVRHRTAVHTQIDINVCQPFLFKNMNYSRNITILIRNH